MSRRIDIELTSALGDGTWTWRAAGARQPKGTLDGAILPRDAKVGDELKVEVEQELDGLSILSVVAGREKHDPELLTLLPVERDFQPVIEKTLELAGDVTTALKRPTTDNEVTTTQGTIIELLVPPDKKGGKGASKMQQMMQKMMAQATVEKGRRQQQQV